MFGYGSFEGYGIKGAAIATLLCRFMMAIVVFLYMKSVMKFVRKRNNQTIKTYIKMIMNNLNKVVIGKLLMKKNGLARL